MKSEFWKKSGQHMKGINVNKAKLTIDTNPKQALYASFWNNEKNDIELELVKRNDMDEQGNYLPIIRKLQEKTIRK